MGADVMAFCFVDVSNPTSRPRISCVVISTAWNQIACLANINVEAFDHESLYTAGSLQSVSAFVKVVGGTKVSADYRAHGSGLLCQMLSLLWCTVNPDIFSEL